ncbi:MAG: amidase [Acidimicrobiia bacterium]
MTAANELARLDATGQAALVRTGEATPLELIDAAIARIEAVNPTVNAVIHERFERARSEATGPLPDGPLRGVPFLLKDLHTFSAGDPHHGGTGFLKAAGWTSTRDDDITTRLRATGVVFVGRTNSPELGTTITTEPAAHGASRNPWNTAHSTGGSSGGSAAAVAARMVPAAHASDGGGSIRIPASECGLVGLKPTRGRVPLGPDISDSWAGSTVHGVVSRTVRDTAVLLDAMSGPVAGDFYRTAPLAGPLVNEVGRDPGRLRIGVLDHPLLPGVEASTECAAAVRSVAELLDGLGHDVEHSWPEAMTEEHFIGAFTTIVAAHVAHDLTTWGRVLGREIGDDEVEPGNAVFASIGRSFGAVDYLDAVYWQQGWTRRVAQWWRDDAVDRADGFDLLVSPVLNGTPPPLGHLSDPIEGLGRVTTLMQYTAQFNVTGQPALSLPLWWSADGLPVGVQFVAAFGREDLLVRLAAQLEAARPWAERVPPVHA